MTGIQWTDETWNPTTGCDKVSPGCGLPRFDGDDTGGCYAMAMAKRLKGMGQAKYQRDGDPKTSGPGFGVTLHPDVLNLPLNWRKPRKVFVNSMSDLFHDAVPDEYIVRVFDVMQTARRHTFQVLTKRHARMRSFVTRYLSGEFTTEPLTASPLAATVEHPPANIWLGVSVEDQKWADIRVPALVETPAAVRWLSCEPLLEDVTIDALYDHAPGALTEFGMLCMCGSGMKDDEIGCYGNRIDWVVAGGESGPGARPCDLEWLRSLRRQCEEGGVPFFCKQLGKTLGRELGAGPKGGDWDMWPEDLRVREFPRTEAVPA